MAIPLWAEAKQLIRKQLPLALDVFGPNALETLKLRWRHAIVLDKEGNRTEAVAILEDVEQRCRRVFGASHPTTAGAQVALGQARQRKLLNIPSLKF